MKNKFQLIALLFIVHLMITLTAFGQTPSSDTVQTVVYTEEMDRACVECWINSPRKDSIIIELKRFSKVQDSLIIKQQESLSKSKRRGKNLAVISGIGGGIFGVLTGWLITSILK